MGDYFERQADLANPGRKYAQSEAAKNISGAPPLSREGPHEDGGPAAGEPPPTGRRTQVLEALGMARGHCAMKPAERLEKDGKKNISAQPGSPSDGLWYVREGYPHCKSNLGCRGPLCPEHAR
jgi:hypothetical protein